MNNHFTIAINCCNQELWISKCIESCLNQKYDNFDVILVDAISDDATYIIAKSFEKDFTNFKAYQNDIRRPQIENILFLTKQSKDNTIMVSVDGDDYLNGNDVLSKLNIIYNSDEVWVTYGSFINISNGMRAGWVYSYPDHVVKHSLFRDYDWLGTHLRTYRKEIFMKIDEEDFKRDGEFMKTTGDQAFMIPILEMAGSRSKYVSDLLYVYNDSNISRDSSVNNAAQVEMSKYICSKKKYKLLDKL